MKTCKTENLTKKARYDLLDGLRGVAAMMVIVYHLFECFPQEQWLIGHGYLAVDFFFILSGFVIAYAYDDRWQRPDFSVRGFFRRRLVRLHPMVVQGVALGVLCFCLQGATNWNGERVATGCILLAVLLNLFLLPEVPGAPTEVRGNGEMYPLNGVHWSLFFEYIGNILYALLIRRFSTRALCIWTAVLGTLFAVFGCADVVGYGSIGVGWTLDGWNFFGGLLRMSLSFSLGLLLCRKFRAVRIRGAFWLCTLLLVVFMALPSVNCAGWTLGCWHVNANCLYEVACVIVLFPAIVWLAASGKTTDAVSTKVCRFLGEFSYPLYAIHYPSMYLFYHYIGFPDTWRTPAETWGWMVALLVGNVALAWLALRFYDAPLRRWLTARLAR